MNRKIHGTILQIALLIGFAACSSDKPLLHNPGPDPIEPPPSSRPVDPGLSFVPGCLATPPVTNPIAAGSRPLSGIPALTDPDFLPADRVTYLLGDDRVFGMEVDGRFIAIPARILNYHEIATFSIGMKRVTATW